MSKPPECTATFFKCNMLALAFLRIEIFFLLPSLPWDKITPKSWQKTSIPYNIFYYIISPKEFLQKILPKISSQKIFPKNISQKFFQKKIPTPISKNFKDFENVQFPTSHMEAENPFGLVLTLVSHLGLQSMSYPVWTPCRI